jgi:hypothetical protein
MTRIYDLLEHDATVDISAGSPEQYPLGEDHVTFSLSGGMSDDAITLSSGHDTGYTLGSNVSITGIGVPWTTTSGTSDTITLDHLWNNSASSKIQLDGPDADIEINGESLRDMLRTIEQRLNILKPNPELESEWAELKTLGDAYRKLEADIKAKMKTWEAISK